MWWQWFGGQCQCGTYLGLLDAKMMFLITIYRPQPPSLLFPRLCVICDIYQSPLMWMEHSLRRKSLLPCTGEGFKQVKETLLLLFGVLGDSHLHM